MVKHVEHYHLHQWEPGGSFLRMGFNEGFAKIDSAIAAWGNCSQVVGTYTGDGNYGKGEATVLRFPFRPLAVMAVGGGHQTTLLFLWPGTEGMTNDTAGMGSVLFPAWGEDSLSRYVIGQASGSSTSGGIGAEGQLNEKGVHYTYLVLG